MIIVKCSKLKKAFTLLELLLVLAIFSVLAGLVIFNLRPADILQRVNNTKNLANANNIEKAIETYMINHGGNLPASIQGNASGEYTICKQGEVSCPVGSISLDELINEGYLSVIPVNTNLAGEKTTGYTIKYDATKETVEIVSGQTVTATPSPTPNPTPIVTEYGTGADGAVTISSNKNINTDTIATGRTCADGINYSVTALTANSATLSSTPATNCLAVNDTVLLINLQGISTNYTNVGNYELLTVQSASGTNVTFTANKTKYYGNGASDDTNIGTATTNQRVMLQRVPNYTDVTVNNGVTLTASAWDGTKGGVIYFRASGTTSAVGIISVNGQGYTNGHTYLGYGVNAGGGGGGGSYGSPNLSKLYLGSPGANVVNLPGGIIAIVSNNITVNNLTGNISSNGGDFSGKSGGSSGGSIYLKGNVININTSRVTALGGNGGSTSSEGGAGGAGRIAISGTITGTTNPTYTAL